MSNFDGKHFLNPVPTEVSPKGAFFNILREYFKKHPNQYPAVKPGPFHVDLDLLNAIPTNGVRVTWLGHSTTIIEIDGKRFLTDPVWYDRVSPITQVGPKRFFANPVRLEDLPPIDYILLSHDHYDHLDKGTILKLAAKGVKIITMLTVDKHLISWGINKSQITTLDWWQNFEPSDGFTVTAAPTRHFSGRGLWDRNTTLWGSFAIKSPRNNVYYGADSGYYNGFNAIGERLGPFDLTLLEIGAYNELWADIHMGPENAIKAHMELQGKYLLPIHWGTFSLAFHPWTEPVERLIDVAHNFNIPLVLPSPGQTYNIDEGAVNSEWWKRA